MQSLTSLRSSCPARAIAFAAGGLLALCATAAAADKLVVEAGRVIQGPGKELKDGVIVIENGHITKIGKQGEVDKPWDAPVIGGPKLVAFPGFVEAMTSRGLDRANENLDIAPFLDIRDSIDPISFAFEDYLRWGTTTINVQQGNLCVIGGRGMIVKPYGMTVEEMAVRPDYALKLSVSPKSGKSPATQSLTLRRAFDELKKSLEKQVQDKRDGKDKARREALYQGREQDPEKSKGRAMEGSGWKVDGLELLPRNEIDEKQVQLLELVEGKRDAFVYCGEPMDVRKAVELAKANGFFARTVLVLGAECFKAVDVVAASGLPVVLMPPLVYVERDPQTGKEVETFVPKVFSDANVRFALVTEGGGSNMLWYQAAQAVGRGLDRDKAIAAVTTVPAQILGLGDRVGSLEPGRDGNIVLLNGDPLSVRTQVQYVVLEGKQVYDRSKDIRVKHVLEGLEPRGTAPAAAEPSTASGDKKDEKAEAKKKADAKSDEKSSGAHEVGGGGR